jgi:hypothetical protein
MIILGIQDEEKIRMMLIQESTPSPLYLKNFQEAKTNAEVFVKLNGNFPKPPQRKFHNLALATYDRSRKKVTLDNPGNLYQFAYECQAA